MPRISSNTLFHFTSSKENLLSILEYEFIPHFSLEDWSEIYPMGVSGQVPIIYAILIVCFCDIPLSQTHIHLEHYGEYGIGLTKAWGMRNGITPVNYIHRNSPFASSMLEALGREVLGESESDEIA